MRTPRPAAPSEGRGGTHAPYLLQADVAEKVKGETARVMAEREARNLQARAGRNEGSRRKVLPFETVEQRRHREEALQIRKNERRRQETGLNKKIKGECAVCTCPVACPLVRMSGVLHLQVRH